MRKKSAAEGDTGLELNTAANAVPLAEAKSEEDLRVIVRQQQDQLQKQAEFMSQQAELMSQLNDLVRKTGDSNRIRQYERDNKEFEGFAFSVKLFPTDNGDKVVTKWKMKSDFVADEGRIVKQKLDIWYDEDGEEKKEELNLVDFVRVLKRTQPILATRLENTDGSEVHVDFRVNEETKKTNAFLMPKGSEFFATIPYEGKEYRISNTYLNA